MLRRRKPDGRSQEAISQGPKKKLNKKGRKMWVGVALRR